MEKTIGNLSFKDFLRVIYRERKVLLLSFLGILLLAVVFSFLVTSVYQSDSRVMITVPTEVETSFGKYTFNQDQTSDYMNLLTSEDILSRAITQGGLNTTVGALKRDLSVGYDQNLGRNQFVLSVKDEVAERATLKNRALLDAYQIELRELYADMARGSLLTQSESLIKRNEKEIETLREATSEYRTLLDTLEPTYFYRELYALNPNQAESIARSQGLTAEEIQSLLENGQESYINQNFFALESEIVRAEAKKILLTEENKQLEERLTELKSENLLDTELDVFKNNIRVVQQPTLPEQPVRNMQQLVLLIGFVAAILLSVVITYFYAFWKEQ